jgi:hypothetical protein
VIKLQRHAVGYATIKNLRRQSRLSVNLTTSCCAQSGALQRLQLGFDEFDRAYHTFERKILARQIADIDRDIAEAKREVAKYGNEIDVEIVMHLEITRANWLKYLKHLDQKLKDLEPKASLGELMIEACGSGEPLVGQSNHGLCHRPA